MPVTNPRQKNQCSICRVVKSPDDFYMGVKRGKLVQLSRCKPCHKELASIDRLKRIDKIKARSVEKKEEIAAYQKEYRQRNAEKLKAFYKARHIERKKQRPPRVLLTEEEKRRRKKERLALTENRLKMRIRSRLAACLRDFGSGRKKQRSLEYLGCAIPEFANYVSAQFQRGMSWDNYGSKWHLDHIIPCSSFDHSDEKQIAQCWHFTNFRPMWAKDNLSKGAKITEPQMKLLL